MKNKYWHVASQSCYGQTPEAIKAGYEGCLNQIIGHFLSVHVTIEDSAVVLVNGGAVVVMVGSIDKLPTMI